MRSLVLGFALLAAGCATVPPAPTATDIPINGSRVFPESIASDAAGNLYVGSNAGIIYRARFGAGTAEPWIRPSAENGIKSVFGVFVDEQRNVLWACSNPNFFAQPRQTGTSALKGFDLRTGALRASYDFPADKPAACNDIAVGLDGDVWVSETSGGRIFVLRDDSRFELFAEDPALVGIDGIAISWDGQIYINNVRQNLFQMVRKNRDSGYDGLITFNLTEPLNGPDGLRWMGGNKFLQAEGPGGRVAIVEINGNNAIVTPVRTGLQSSPGVAQVGRVGYAIEGKINYLFDAALRDQSPDPFVIRAFLLPD